MSDFQKFTLNDCHYEFNKQQLVIKWTNELLQKTRY